VDVCNRIYCSGWGGVTNAVSNGGGGGHTYDLTTTPGAFQSTTDSSDFYLIIIEDNASTLSYATFFGGNLATEHVDGGTSRFDRKGVVYQSVCAGCGGFSDFPTTPGAVSDTNNASCNIAVFKFDPEFPLTIANFTAPDLTCENNVQFNNLSYGNNTYWWDFGDGQNSAAENPNHIYSNPGFYEVTLYTSDPTSCNLQDSIRKTIEIKAHQYQELDSLFLCKGESVQLSVPTQADFDYSWSPTSFLSNPTSVNPLASPEDSIQYYLIGNLGDCTDTISQYIAVFEVPLSVSEDQELCGNPVWLFAESNQDAIVNWSASPDFSNPQNDSLLVFVPGPYYAQAQQLGCTTSTLSRVSLSPDCCTEEKITIPNAFSPNEDGQNDLYLIRDEDANIIESLDLQIFNRWGQKVFETKDKAKGWDGYFQGKLLNTAVFDYHLTIGCIGGEKTFFKKGDITLVR
jgi:gliding motility-associated-like protein